MNIFNSLKLWLDENQYHYIGHGSYAIAYQKGEVVLRIPRGQDFDYFRWKEFYKTCHSIHVPTLLKEFKFQNLEIVALPKYLPINTGSLADYLYRFVRNSILVDVPRNDLPGFLDSYLKNKLFKSALPFRDKILESISTEFDFYDFLLQNQQNLDMTSKNGMMTATGTMIITDPLHSEGPIPWHSFSKNPLIPN